MRENVRLHLAVLPGQHAVELPVVRDQPVELGLDTVFLRLGDSPRASGKRRGVFIGELQVLMVVIEGRDVQAHAPVEEGVAGPQLERRHLLGLELGGQDEPTTLGAAVLPAGGYQSVDEIVLGEIHVHSHLPGNFRCLGCSIGPSGEERPPFVELVFVLVTDPRGNGERVVQPERSLTVDRVILTGHGTELGKIQIGPEGRQGFNGQLFAGQGRGRLRERRRARGLQEII